MDILRVAEIVTQNFQLQDLQAIIEDRLPLADLRANGIEPTDLIGLSSDQVVERLSQAGIDIDAIDAGGLRQMAEQIAQVWSQ